MISLKSNEVVVLGAGGHCRALIGLLELKGFVVVGILDDTFDCQKEELIFEYPLIGNSSIADKYSREAKIVLAVGNNLLRKKYFEEWSKYVWMENIVHPSAIVEKRAVLGNANQIFAKTVVNSGAIVGDNNIINTGAILEHEVFLGNHNHVSVGSILCGRVRIGDNCFIGAGSVVIDKIRVCDNVVIGANSVVIKDIDRAGTYVGSPVRRVK